MHRLPWFVFASAMSEAFARLVRGSIFSDSQGGLGSSRVDFDAGITPAHPAGSSAGSWPGAEPWSWDVARCLYEGDVLAKLSKGLVAAVYCGFIAVSVRLALVGLPNKMPRHPSVEDGCPRSWVVFMGVVYAFIYFTTDQYVPSLPQMEVDLLGSESLMSGTVQMNLCIKAVFGMATAGLSDRIGRRPVLLVCLTLLSLASFCCGCARKIEWFIASRLLQGMGESLEPVIFAMARDYFAEPSERFVVVAALQMMAFVGIALAPLVGGLGAHYLSWRASFFGLALIWGLLASYAGLAMVECCPDGESQSYLSDLSRILDPHLLCLLLTESCVMGAYFTFNANSSYLAEVVKQMLQKSLNCGTIINHHNNYQKARWLGLWKGGLLALLCWAGSNTSLAGAAGREDGTCCSLATAPSGTLLELHAKNKRLPKLKIVSAAAQLLLATPCANPCDGLQKIEAKNKDLRKLLKKFQWPRLKYFWASGRTYSLPLRAESRELSHRPANARLEYLAGFFDGDGCVSCQTCLSGCMLVVVQSCDQAEVLMLFREELGGSISRLQEGKGLRKPMLQWRVCGDSARRAARLLAPRSITKQKQLLLASPWPKTKSRREGRKAELCALKKHDSAVSGPCSWSYFAGFFDAEGYIKQKNRGASLSLEIKQKHPRVLGSLREFVATTSGIDTAFRNYTKLAYCVLCVSGLSNCKQILQRLLEAGLLCKATQAQLALSLTPENAAEVSTELAGLTGNQMCGKRLETAGQERANKISAAQKKAASFSRRGLHTEAETQRHEVAELKQEHVRLKAVHENHQLLEYIRKLQSLHENSWEGPLAPGM
ncbi:AQR1 [Symbiodinium sp. CCMP2456]|nr:AQR1 [Symbiodinium sp. CCMP2456]